MHKPAWVTASELMEKYYDTEWGMPVRDEAGLFERLSLEGFQSGLSWNLILTRRDAFRRAFADFDADVVARFDEADVERLLADASIIRNRAKIEATIAGARATIALRDEGGLVDFVWSFKPETTPRPHCACEIPTQSPESVALAKALKKRGFKFVGPVTVFALMEAIGMVDTH